MPKKGLLIITFLLFSVLIGYGQLNNSFLYDSYDVNPADSGALRLGFDVLGYLKNNEYGNDIVPGYTLFGYQFKPYLSYLPARHFRIDLGGYFSRDFGDDGFNEIRPVFTLKYQREKVSFLFGTLEGAASHRLIEPIFDFENVITHRIEDGIQFRYAGDRLFLDTWLDWLDMIRFGDDDQERFNAGLNFNGTLFRHSRFEIQIPIQIMAHHRGGQIDISPAPAVSFINAASGLSLVFPLHSDLLTAVRLDNYYVISAVSDPVPESPYSDGDGLFIHVTGTLKWFELMLSYWHGNEFYSPNGGRLYQSVSYDPMSSGYVEEKRDLLFFRMLYERELFAGCTLAFRFEPSYDMNNQLFEHAEALYIRFNTDFLLNKKKRP